MPIHINVSNLKKSATSIVTVEASAEHLSEKHYQEWVASGVHPEIIKLNVRSIAGKQIVDHLNLATLSPWALQRRYNDVLTGGWVCGSIFKADIPREAKGKPVKYENPTGVETQPILLQLPEHIWQQIAVKYGVSKPENMDGWEWVINTPAIPVVIVEGVKKAGCVMTSMLIPAIALSGHRTAYIQDGDVRFAQFLHTDRDLVLCFDNDSKTSTRAAVATTIHEIIKRITRADNGKGKDFPQARANLSICHWQGLKGIDDVFINRGLDAVSAIFNSTTSWVNWVDDSSNTLGFAPDVTFNSSKFQYVALNPATTLVAIKGAKGSGKTWYLEQLTREAREAKRPIISIVHRIQLAISIAGRLGLTYIEDIDGKVAENNSTSLVIDSLSKVNPANFKGGLIIIDEVVQVLEHLMTSDTCAAKRQKILKTLRELAQTIIESGGQFVLADADINEATIRFFIGLIGDEVTPFIIHNEYREPSYTCYISEGHKQLVGKREIHTPTDVIATALQVASQGKRVIICLTGQDEQSQWGTINLEKLFLSKGINSVLRIDSETTKNPEHPAYKATSKINALCDNFQVVIGSPSMGTGVSIENRIPFDLCCGVFSGVGSPDGVRQFLMRLRDKSVPRLVWIAEQGLGNKYNNLGSTTKSVDTNSREQFEFTQALLTEHDEEWCAEYPEIRHCNTSSVYFNNLIATKNKETPKYKRYVMNGLKIENVNLIEVTTANNVYPCEIDYSSLYVAATETKKTSVEDYRKALEAQPIISDDEYTKLKNQDALTDNERLSKEAKIISNRYGNALPVTEELVAKDADGWYSQLRLHYACTVGHEVMQDLQALSASSQVISGEGSVIRHDFNDRQKLISNAAFIRESGLLDLIDKAELSANDPDCVEVFEHLVAQSANIKLLFNKTLGIKKTDKFSFQPIQVMLEAMGITAQKQQKRDGKKMTRVYRAVVDDKVEKVFTAWLARDTEKASDWAARKHEWEVKRLVKTCSAEVDLQYFEALQSRGIFDEVWEHVNTDTRINIINRVDNFVLPTPIKKEIDPNADDYQAILTDIASWTEISLDLETFGNDKKNKEGLHPHKGQIRLIQISNGSTIYFANLGGRADDRKTIKASLSAFLTLLNNQLVNPNIKIIGQNIHFDLRFLRFQLDSGRTRNISDTMLGAKVFFGDYGKLQVLPGGYGLGNLARKFLGIAIDKTEQKSDWGAVLTPEQIEYAVTDPYITYWVHKRIVEVYENPAKFGFGKLAQDGLMDAWQLENAIVPCAVELEFVGLPFDGELAGINLAKCQAIQEQLLREWSELVPGLTYGQNEKLVRFLNDKYNTNIKSLNKAALADLGEYPEIKLLSKLRAIKVPIQQYESLIRSAEATGRVRTTFNTLTGTGRFSSGNSKMFNDLPNLQSISAKEHPALKEYGLPGVRTCVTTDKASGFKYWIIDHKSAKKQLTKYEKLAATETGYSEYIAKSIAYLKQLISLDEQVDYTAHDLNWVDDKNFVKTFRDDISGLESITRKLTNKAYAIVDLAASHGRIAADVANDEVAIAGCNDDSIDNHSKVAVFVAGAQGVNISYDEIAANRKQQPYKGYRDASKNTYYGWLNGAGANCIQKQIKSNSGQVVAIEACQAAIKGCEELYPNVVNFRKQLVAELSDKKNLLHVDGKYYAINKIASVSNRILHLVTVDGNDVDLPYTQCLAAIWSRTEATALKRALLQLFDLKDANPEWELNPTNYVHDEINVEYNSAYAKEAAQAVNNIIGDCFAATLSKVSDGRETNWTKLVVNNWSEK
jgi:hypothetical protein